MCPLRHNLYAAQYHPPSNKKSIGKVPMRNDMSIIYIKIRPFPHRHNTLSARPYDKRSKVQALNIIVPIKSKENSHNHTPTY